MSHTWIGHVLHMNVSRQTYQRAVRLFFGARQRTNALCHTKKEGQDNEHGARHTYQHTTHLLSFFCVLRIMTHTWICHVTRMDALHQTYQRVVHLFFVARQHTNASRHIKKERQDTTHCTRHTYQYTTNLLFARLESCRTYEQIMPNTRMCRVTHGSGPQVL